MVEGVIQKSKKILKISKKLKLDSWGWLSEYSKPKVMIKNLMMTAQI